MLTSHVSLPLQGKHAEADPLYVRATDILETAFGPDHPQVASSLNNRAVVLADQVTAVKNSVGSSPELS